MEQPPLQISAESILEVMAAEGTAAADAAVRAYSATLHWPPVPDPVRFELCLRLRVAIWWVETLSDTDADGEQLPDFLTQILIDYWRDVGRTDWLLNELIYRDEVL